MLTEFKVYTNKGSWAIEADTTDVRDALRKALWFCWRDGEEFDHMESSTGNTSYRIAVIYNGDMFTL